MKKSLSMLLVGSMLVTALAGCGGNTDTQGAGDGQDNTDAAATAFLIGGTDRRSGDLRQRGQERRRACGGGDQRGRRGYSDQGHFRG